VGLKYVGEAEGELDGAVVQTLQTSQTSQTSHFTGLHILVISCENKVIAKITDIKNKNDTVNVSMSICL
jgi:hypothetical protein